MKKIILLYTFLFLLFMSLDAFENDHKFFRTSFKEVECEFIPLSIEREKLVKRRKKPGRRFLLNGLDFHPSFCKLLKQGHSLNWSGYFVLASSKPVNQSVAGVAGEWVIPTLLKSSNASCSIFVGLDGFTGSDLEQIGTGHHFKNGKQENFCWFQVNAHQIYEIEDFLLSPGDHIGAGVVYKGDNLFELRIVNYTKNIYLVVPPSYTKSSNALRNSAEWIVQAPKNKEIFPLANFGTISFFNCRAEINGITEALNSKHFVVGTLKMISESGLLKAIPSAVQDGNSFSVNWKSS